MKNHPTFGSRLPLSPRLAARKALKASKKNHSVEVLESRIAPAAALGVTKVAVFAPGGDVNSNGIFDPGDTILYTVTLTNTGTVDLSGVTFTDILDGNLTLGNVDVSPLAFNDTYSAVANTQLVVGNPTALAGPKATASGHVIDNDTEFMGDTFTLTSFEATSANGGTVSMVLSGVDAGSFSYLPAAGFTGTDTFHYTIKDKGLDGIAGNADDLSSIGTVTITVGAQKVWYVDNKYDAVANGPSDGRSAHPFTSLTGATQLNGAAGAGDVDGPGDIIYVHNTGGNAADYTGGITLEANQTLQGQGDVLQVGGFTLQAAGTRPNIVNAAATSNDINLGSGNTLHGFNLGTATNAAIFGNNFGTLTIDNININTANAGLDLTTGTIAGTGFGSVTAKNVILNSLAGTLHLGTGALSSTGALDAFHVAGGAASIDFSGTITQTSGAGDSVDIANKSGGTVALSGLVTDNGGGILLSNNTGATINFTGGITASTGASKAFSATGGGTISVTGANNTLATTTATALEVDHTTIAAAGLTFKSISAGTAGGGPVKGISLDTTGNQGGLTVTGTGTTAGSGGTIQKGTHGVYASNTINLSLSNMNIINNGLNQTVAGSASTAGGDIVTGNNLSAVANVTLFTVTNVTLTNLNITGSSQMGLNGNAVNGLTITNSNINSNGNESFESGIILQNASGTISISGTSVRDNRARELQIGNGSGSMTLNLTNSQFGHTNAGTGTNESQQGVLLQLFGTSNTTINATTLTIANNEGIGFTANGFQINADNGGPVVSGSISSSTFDNNAAHVIVNAAGTSTVTFDTLNNATMTKAALQAIDYAVLGGSNAITANLTGTISGNTINNSGLPAANAHGIDINSGSTWAGQMHIKIANNNISGVSGGIITTLDGNDAANSGSPRADIRITGNTLTPIAGATEEAIKLNAATTSSHPKLTVGWDVGGAGALANTVSGHWANGSSEASVYLRNRFTAASSIILPGYGGGAADDAAVQSYLAGRNSIAAPGGTGVATLVTHNNTNPFVSGTVTTPLLYQPAPGEVVVVTPTGTDTTPTGTDGGSGSGGASSGGSGGSGTTTPVIVDDGVLSQAELDSLVQAAIARWEATGLTPAQDAILHSVTFSVKDLPGWYLGESSAGNVVLDRNAAGNSWFIDPTPNDDSEFSGTGTQLGATADGGAAGRIDALSTIMHELGHQLGLDDQYQSTDTANLMYGFLHQGERRLPAAHQADGAAPHFVEGSIDFALSPITIGALPVGKSVQVVFTATIHTDITANSVSNQATGSSTETGNVNSNTVVTAVDLPNVTIDVNTASMAENSGGAFTYTFHRTGATDFTRVVNFSVSGTATAGTDYTLAGATSFAGGVGTVTFAAGSDTATITVTPTGDTTVENNETAIVTVTPGTGYDVTAPSSATGTINNDDTAVVSITGATVTEGDSGTKNLGFTISMTNPVDVDTTVTFNTTAGTATAGTDFVGQTNVTVTIPAGQTSVTKNVVINGDTTVEADEAFTATISNLAAGGRTGVSLGTATATGNITNDDASVVSITGASVTEGNSGTKNLNFTIGMTNPSDVDTIVTFNTADGTATTGNSDYVGQTNITVTIPAGQTSVTKSVVINGDNTVENDETFTGTISGLNNGGRAGVTLGTATATGTITNDDAATVSISSPTITEGNAGTASLNFIISLSNPVDVDTTVTFNTADGTATAASGDYDALTNQTVTIPAGQASATKTVTVHGDNLVELTETFTATISNLSAGGRTGVTLGTVTGTGTITNDDTANITITGGSITEGDSGTKNLPYTINLSNPIDTDIVVVFSTNATGTATAGTDFVAQSNVAITIPAGTTTATRNVVVNGDTSAEADETVGAVLGLQNSGGRNVSITGSSATGTIINDDTEISVSVSPGGVFEDGATNLVYTFTRVGYTGNALPVNVTISGTAGLTGDYSATGFTSFNTGTGAAVVTFAGESSTATVTIDPTADVTGEADETVVFTLGTGTGYGLGAQTVATGTILNDDTAVSVAVAPASVAENSATGHVYTFTRTGDTSTALTVNFGVGGTAAFTTDYTATGAATFTASTGSVVIPIGQSSATVTLIPVNDVLVEGSETEILTVATGSGYSPAGTPATGTITDNDTATIGYVSTTSSVGEGAGNDVLNFVLTITADGTGTAALASDVTFNVTKTGGTATDAGTDYTLPGVVTFTAGAVNGATQTANLAIVNDALVEGNETAVLGLTMGASTAGGQVTINAGANAHTTTITDNDTATITYSAATSSIGEGAGNDALGFVLTINANGTGTPTLTKDVTFNVTSVAGGTATGGGTDYTLPGTVTFAAGALSGASQSANLGIVNDALVEGSETATLGLALGTDGTGGQVTIGAANSHTTTITDNDTATVSFVAATSSVGEAGLTDTLNYVLNITANGTGTPALAKDVIVNVTTAAGGTATAGTDYTLPTAVTFATGAISGATKSSTLGIIDDALVEGAETSNLTLGLTDGTGGQVTVLAAGANHTTTINDNDTATITYTSATSTVGEAAGNDVLSFTLNITAIGTGTAALASDVTFNVTTTGGTATGAGTDYTLPAGPITFTAGSNSGATKTANLAIVNDAHVEGSETAILGLAMGASTAGGQVTIGGANSHTTTITDNDTATFAWVTPPSNSSLENVGTVDRVAKLVITANGAGAAVLDRDVTLTISQFSLGATGGGVDFSAPTSLTFNAGAADASTKALTITVVNDALVEGDETVQFTFGSIATDGTGGQVSLPGAGANTTGLTITDNDTASFSFVTATSNGSETAGTGTFNIQLTINANGTGTPALAIDLTALPTINFGASTATLTTDYAGGISALFPSGSASGITKTATVTIVDDALVEGNETIVFSGIGSAGPGSGSVVPTAGSHTMTIADNDVNLNISKTDSATTAIPGTQVTYIITVNNPGLTTATGATVADLFPGALTNVSWTVIGVTANSSSAGVGSSHSGDLNDTVTVAPGGTITYSVTGMVAPGATGTLSNTATIAAPTGFTDQTPGDNSATDTDTLVPTGDLSITKTDGKVQLVPGTNDTYTITVSNPGPSNVVGAHVDDLFPAGFLNPTFTAAGSAGTVFTASGGGDLHDTVNIPAGGSITYTVTGLVASGLLGSFANTATVTAPNGFTDGNTANNNATDTDTLTPQADVSIVKTGPATIIAGTDITYHLTVTNNGPSDAQNVNPNDVLPAGVTLVSFTQTSGPTAGGTLPTGGTMTFDLVGHVGSGVAASTTLANTATVTSSTPDLNGENNASTVFTSVITQADLALTKTDAPDPVNVGGQLTYTITLHNNGASDAQNVSITDTLPAGFTLFSISIPGGWSATTPGFGSSGTITLTKSTVTAAEDDTFTVVVVPGASTGGQTITNTATVTATTTDPVPGNNSASATTTVQGTDLTLTKENGGALTIVPGDTVTYNLHYTNNGFVTATGVVITETLPAGTTFLSADNPGWTQVGATNQYQHTVPDLAVGATGSLPFIVHVKSAVAAGLETIANTATITDDGASGPDIHPTDNTATDTDTLNAAPDLAVNLAGSPQTAVRGGGVVYTINYANVGNQDATGVVLTQTLPPNTTFDSFHSGSWTYIGNNTYTHTVGELDVAAGAQSIDFAVTLNTNPPAGVKTFSTTSSIDDDHANGTDPVTANNTATATTGIYQGIYAVSTGIALPRTGPAATVRVFDIATGAEMSFQPYGATYKQSIRIAVGDINGDGYDDIITSTITGNGQVRVFDGQTLQRMGGVFAEDIAAFPEKGARGAYVASGDVNGDGRDDIIVGSGYRAGGDALVRVFSGQNGQLLNTSTPFGTKFHGGVRVAVGDVNGDGVADIIAGQGFGGNEVKVTTLQNRQETSVGSHVSVVKPAETVLLDFEVGGKHYNGGVWVGAAADLNGDGKADIIVGRDRGDTVIETYSGANGDLLHTITPFGTRYKLGVRVAAADINLDGIADIIAGSGGRNNSTVKIFDGVTNMEIPALTFQAFPATPTGALFVAGTSPVPVLRTFQQPV